MDTNTSNAEIRAKLMDAEAILLHLSEAEKLLQQDSPEVLVNALAEKAQSLVSEASEALELQNKAS
jgi:hypothetical protein